MPLVAGTRLGPYQIAAPIGAGGMGEVYKANDTRLGRQVAIKVSAEEFTERFEREARAIAALNHPNICQLYDVGPNYLVMELIEGSPLKGPLPLEQVLKYAAQICDALDAAHRKGITHRDLKPANILLTKSGVKLLDFGLAKYQRESSGDGAPTLTIGVTQAGAVMGTPAYMAPEQWKGQPADARTDVYAFGCVLYELLTGELASQPAAGTSARRAAIEKQPPAIQSIIRTCLAGDPLDRWQSARDVHHALELAAANLTPSNVAPSSRKTQLGWITATIFGAAAIALAFLHIREKPTEAPMVQFVIPQPGKLNWQRQPIVSPDGKRIVFQASDGQGKVSLWIRELKSQIPKVVPGTEGALFPIWSPDSRYLAFQSGRQLRKVGVDDSIIETICEFPLPSLGGAWAPDGNILLAFQLDSLYIVPSSGGALKNFTSLDVSHKETRHYSPSITPDGKHVLFLVTSSVPETQGVWIASLSNPADRRRLLPVLSQAVYSSGHLLFVRDGNLVAQPFDLRSLKTTGDAVPLVRHVPYNEAIGIADFSASPTGVLAIGGHDPPVRLVTFDRSGRVLGAFGASVRRYQFITLSPNETRVAADSPVEKGYQIFVFDPARDATMQLTGAANTGNFPVWSPDGARIAFGSNRDGVYNIYIKPSSGASQDEVLLKNDRNKFVMDWSRDGRYLLFGEDAAGTKRKEDLWILPMNGSGKPSPYLQDEYNKRDGRFSADSHWVAYWAPEATRPEIFVRPFPSPTSKLQISTNGGTRPRWRDDGKELFYMDLSGRLMAVELRSSGDTLTAGVPKPLFETGLVNNLESFDVSRGGQRFVMGGRIDAPEEPISVILNWTGLLRSGVGQR